MGKKAKRDDESWNSFVQEKRRLGSRLLRDHAWEKEAVWPCTSLVWPVVAVLALMAGLFGP